MSAPAVRVGREAPRASVAAVPPVNPRVDRVNSQQGGGVDVLVQIEEGPAPSPVLAHVNSVPSPLGSEWHSCDVVTLYGVPSPESLALALAAAVEGQRDPWGNRLATRHLGVWAERGAVGDASWFDHTTGEVVSYDLDIPLDRLRETAGELLGECGQLLRRVLAGLLATDWPEGMGRAINFSFSPVPALAGVMGGEGFLDLLREADRTAYDSEES